MNRPPTRRGFTLLEMLTATVMVAVLAGSLYASLHVAFKARRTALSAVETVRKCNQSIELIKADLVSAVPPGSRLAGPFVGTSGQGTPGASGDDLTFYAAATDIEPAPGVGDIKKIEYCCDQAVQDKQTLLVRRLTTNLLAPQTPEPCQEVICRGVRTFAMRYYDGTTWQTAWDSTAQNNLLPPAVEVTVELEGDSPNQPGPRISQVIPVPCGRPADTTTSAGGSP